jgi:hypothetical protein
VNMAVIPAETDRRWYPPDPEHTDTYPINFLIGDLGRIIGRAEFDEANRMTEFSLTAQTYLAGAWWDVARVDSADGEVHVHYFYRTRTYADREVLFPIRCQNDVDRGYVLADKLLVVCWDDNVRRWRHGES